VKDVAGSERTLEYIERRRKRLNVASKLIIGPDIRMQMLRASADVNFWPSVWSFH